MDCLPQLHTIAIHARAGFRSAVPGIGVLCRESEFVAGAGIYSNSIGRRSDYAVIGWQPWTVSGVRLGAIVGVVNGYNFKNGGVIPMVAGVITWGGINLTILPPAGNKSPVTFQLSLTPWRTNIPERLIIL